LVKRFIPVSWPNPATRPALTMCMRKKVIIQLSICASSTNPMRRIVVSTPLSFSAVSTSSLIPAHLLHGFHRGNPTGHEDHQGEELLGAEPDH
jgi:hypothetical protein